MWASFQEIFSQLLTTYKLNSTKTKSAPPPLDGAAWFTCYLAKVSKNNKDSRLNAINYYIWMYLDLSHLHIVSCRLNLKLRDRFASDLHSTVCCCDAPNFPSGIIKVSSHLFPSLFLSVAIYKSFLHSYLFINKHTIIIFSSPPFFSFLPFNHLSIPLSIILDASPWRPNTSHRSTACR